MPVASTGGSGCDVFKLLAVGFFFDRFFRAVTIADALAGGEPNIAAFLAGPLLLLARALFPATVLDSRARSHPT